MERQVVGMAERMGVCASGEAVASADAAAVAAAAASEIEKWGEVQRGLA